MDCGQLRLHSFDAESAASEAPTTLEGLRKLNDDLLRRINEAFELRQVH